MMTRATLEVWLAERQGVGPEGSLDNLASDLDDLVATIGEAGAPILAECVIAHDDRTSYEASVLLEVVEAYARRFPVELATAAAPLLRADGPPLLVTTLGLVRDPRLVATIRGKLDLTHPSDALLSSIADLVMDADARDSVTWLDSLLARSDIRGLARDDLLAAQRHLVR